ncbi:MAG: hypothetical protein AAFX53_04330 [Bacteroidota bacterium]
MKKQYFSFALALFLIAACKTDHKKGGKPGTSQKDHPELTLIQGLPEGFAGCSCILSKTDADLKVQKYVYLKKYGMVDRSLNYEMISLNGEVVQWPENQSPENFSLEIHYNSSEGQDPESNKKTGKMILHFKDGTKLETAVSGYCGC